MFTDLIASRDIPIDGAEGLQALRWRHALHRHPELGFEERWTADFVCRVLGLFDCEVTRGIGGTGVVATLRNGSSARSIGLRADMDALPIHETAGRAHRSEIDGRMHACGHDGHMAMLLDAVAGLARTRRFDGVVHFIFQPAEEGLGGGNAMLADSLFERFPCDSIFAIHNKPGLAVGRFAIRPGAMMAGGVSFDIEIEGKGSHGAQPETGIDPVVVASHVVLALQTIVSRNVAPAESCVLSATQIHAGDAYNVVPQTAVVRGTLRAFSAATLGLMQERLHRIATNVAVGLGARARVTCRPTFAPLVNDQRCATFMADVAASLAGESSVDRACPAVMASEDFAFMLQRRPGAYMYIGNGDEADFIDIHHAGYDFNDAALPWGSALLQALVERGLPLSEAEPRSSHVPPP